MKIFKKIFNKIIDTYNGFTSRDSGGAYYWTNKEIWILESIGMSRDILLDIVPFYYRPNNSKLITQIEINKCAEVISYTGYEDYFFKVLINFKTRKRIKFVMKDFDTLDKAIKYVEKYIDPIEVESKKFNI